jgi:hypothetical protein
MSPSKLRTNFNDFFIWRTIIINYVTFFIKIIERSFFENISKFFKKNQILVPVSSLHVRLRSTGLKNSNCTAQSNLNSNVPCGQRTHRAVKVFAPREKIYSDVTAQRYSVR